MTLSLGIIASFFTAVTMILFGGVYHVVLWSVGRLAFSEQAEGSLVRRADGTVVGSLSTTLRGWITAASGWASWGHRAWSTAPR